MSTTLTNGIIIPDNGSRNWGGDLANNWNILDLNVGYMNDVKNRVTTLENSVAENTANIEINTSNISALQTSKQDNLSEQQIANIADVTNKANIADVVHKSGGTMTGDLLCDGNHNLGTSTNKWKTLNGINPGALSLPNHNLYLDLKGNLPASVSDNLWIPRYQFTPEQDGILILTFNNCAAAVVWSDMNLPSYGDWGTSICTEKRVMAFVLKGAHYYIYTNNYSQVALARLFYFQGNV